MELHKLLEKDLEEEDSSEDEDFVPSGDFTYDAF
jgi:hypothetical protein